MTIFSTARALAIAACLLAPAAYAEPATAPAAAAPAAVSAKPPLTNLQALSLLDALRNLDGHMVVQQGGAPVLTPWEFSNGGLRLRIARNITALTAVSQAIETTRNAILREILKTMPPDKDGKPQQNIQPNTPERATFDLQFGDVLSAPAQVDLFRIKASELRLDKNDIPGTVLSALSPIFDDDVSPK